MRVLAALSLLLIASSAGVADGDATPAADRAHLVIHGGAGTMDRDKMTEEREAEYLGALTAALETGHRILAGGGSALDAVEATIRTMEDSPLFNAGRGAVFTADGRNELDASIMDGAAGTAGAVAGVTRIKNPISAARAVMERTWHVLLAGPGAEAFARAQGLEMADPSYFATEHRREQLREKQDEERRKASDAASVAATDRVFGTVGAAAVDAAGRIAVGTSTGGLTNKRHGRVGDSPIIGAGTYANARCAVSGTGQGEYFIRHAVAYDVCARMEYTGATLGEAARAVIHETLTGAGGEGGIIALGADGAFALEFNTPGMYRGWAGPDGEPHVAIFGSD